MHPRQLGDGTNTNRPTAVRVRDLTGVQRIAAGPYHSLAFLSDGTVRAWGNNAYGQLGDATNTNRSTPVYAVKQNGYPRRITAAPAWGYHSYAL